MLVIPFMVARNPPVRGDHVYRLIVDLTSDLVLRRCRVARRHFEPVVMVVDPTQMRTAWRTQICEPRLLLPLRPSQDGSSCGATRLERR